MSTHKRILSIQVILFCISLIVFSGAIGAQTSSHPALDADRVLWSELSFQAQSLFVTVFNDVRLSSFPAGDMRKLLTQSPKGTSLQASNSRIHSLTVETTIDPIFRSPVKLFNEIWFNSKAAEALGGVRSRRGEDDFYRVFRFTQEGVYRLQREPADEQEASLASGQWSRVREAFYPHGFVQLAPPHVSEVSLLIYVVSAAVISQAAEPVSLYVFGKRRLHHVRLQAVGLTPLEVDYLEKSQAHQIRKKHTLDALKIALETQPIGSADATERFSFFGFQKGICFYLEPHSRIPIGVSGVIPAAGEVRLRLREVKLREWVD